MKQTMGYKNFEERRIMCKASYKHEVTSEEMYQWFFSYNKWQQ